MLEWACSKGVTYSGPQRGPGR